MSNIEKIRRALESWGVMGAEINEDSRFVYISIIWGDWKHEHQACKQAMHDAGYDLFDYEVTESDGSDCYSAEYVFELAA